MLGTSRRWQAAQVFPQPPARDCDKGRMVSRAMNSAVPGATSGTGDMRSLVIRAWLEPGHAPQLRARIVEITAGRSERPMVITTSVDEACRVIRNWLETLQAQGSNGQL